MQYLPLVCLQGKSRVRYQLFIFGGQPQVPYGMHTVHIIIYYIYL